MRRIVWALDNLPERVPNVIQFKNLCRMAPAPEVPMLPEPPADPARVAAELAKLAPMMAERTERVDPKAWAKKLRFRSLAGERLNSFQIQAYKQALKEEA
jgi:crotonobetainyl-CoA:carnitine CoA-transferase CaiB-like acyl-CoA transferase